MRLLTLLFAFFATFAAADEPAIEELGDERYRIGSIVVDKAAGEFTVPGRLVNVNETLEYVAVVTDGVKNYESLLELETSAVEFKLACILIGLDDASAVKPRYQFDEREVEGPPVAMTLAWQDGDDERRVPVADALLSGDEVFGRHDWVYIGSTLDPDGNFMAAMDGSLIGFVHDPVAIIEHRQGGGIGSYGLITGNPEMLPRAGSRISLTVARRPDAED